jgi:hypothetical protein
MAEDLRSVSSFPHFHTVACTTAATEIQLPSQASQVTVGCEAAATLIGQNGQADTVAMTSSSMFIPSGNVLSVKLGRGSSRAGSIFIAMKTGTGTIKIILEEL